MDGQSTENAKEKRTYSSVLVNMINENVGSGKKNEASNTKKTPTKDKQTGFATADLNKKVELLLAENHELKVNVSFYKHRSIKDRKKLNSLVEDNEKLKKRISIFNHNNVNLKKKLNSQISLTEVSQQEARIQSAICKHMTDIINRI